MMMAKITGAFLKKAEQNKNHPMNGAAIRIWHAKTVIRCHHAAKRLEKLQR